MPKAEQETAETRLDVFHARLAAMQHDIDWMRKLGGWTDTKTLSQRATRAEDRMERLERDNGMLVQMVQTLLDFCVEHSRDRHDADPAVRGENNPDVILLRRGKRHLAEWMEACRPKRRLLASE